MKSSATQITRLTPTIVNVVDVGKPINLARGGAAKTKVRAANPEKIALLRMAVLSMEKVFEVCMVVYLRNLITCIITAEVQPFTANY